jgi:cyclic nucleotide gated channel alpha 3
LCGCHVADCDVSCCRVADRDVAVLQDAVRQEMERQVTMDQKLERIESSLDNLSTRFARLLSDFNSTQLKLKQRITKIEKLLSRDGDAVSNASALEYDSK